VSVEKRADLSALPALPAAGRRQARRREKITVKFGVWSLEFRVQSSDNLSLDT
jgi:hypothetical protein